MQLLIAVVNDPEKVDDILAGYLEIGITGATVINSEGMGRILTHDIPIFAGLQTLISRSKPQNRTLFSVVEDEKVEQAFRLLKQVCGDLESPATGIAFSIPVNKTVGLAGELGGETNPL